MPEKRPRPPQWERRRPSFSARHPQEDPEWRPFERSSKETPPPRCSWTWRRSTPAAVGTVPPLPTGEGRVGGRLPRGHGGQRADIFMTPTPSSPPATGTEETADIAEEWLEEEAEMSPWSRKVRVRITVLPTGAQSPPRARPRRPGGLT